MSDINPEDFFNTEPSNIVEPVELEPASNPEENKKNVETEEKVVEGSESTEVVETPIEVVEQKEIGELNTFEEAMEALSGEREVSTGSAETTETSETIDASETNTGDIKEKQEEDIYEEEPAEVVPLCSDNENVSVTSDESISEFDEDECDESELTGAKIMAEDSKKFNVNELTDKSPYLTLIMNAFKECLRKGGKIDSVKERYVEDIISLMNKYWEVDHLKTLTHFLYEDINDPESLNKKWTGMVLRLCFSRKNKDGAAGIARWFLNSALMRRNSMLNPISWNMMFGGTAKSWGDLMPIGPISTDIPYSMYFLNAEFEENEESEDKGILRRVHRSRSGLRIGLLGKPLKMADNIHFAKRATRVFVWSPILKRKKSENDVVTFRYVLVSYGYGEGKENMFRGIFISRFHPQEGANNATHCAVFQKLGGLAEIDVKSSAEFALNYVGLSIRKNANGQYEKITRQLPLRQVVKVINTDRKLLDPDGQYAKYIDEGFRQTNAYKAAIDEAVDKIKSGGTNTDENQNSEYSQAEESVE